MNEARIRHRQGPVQVVDGVPYPSRDGTLSLLPVSVVGRWLASHAGDVRGTLLDLGAGNQPFRPWYSGLADRVVAVDVTPTAGLDARCFATALPFADDSFDAVLCTSVLEHVENVEQAVAEIARVLRPGGRLLVAVPFLYPEHEAPYDFWRTTHQGLRSVLSRHGLEVHEVAAQGGPFLMLAHYLIQALVQFLRLVAGRSGPAGRLLDNRAVTRMIAAPQEAVRSHVSYRLSPLARIASLGYMAAASKPDGASSPAG